VEGLTLKLLREVLEILRYEKNEVREIEKNEVREIDGW